MHTFYHLLFPLFGRPLLHVEGASALACAFISGLFHPPLGRPLSPVESGGKPPGRNRKAIPPGPQSASLFVARAAATRGGSGCRGSPEFPLSAEAILCKFAASFPCGLSGSRCEAWWCVSCACLCCYAGVWYGGNCHPIQCPQEHSPHCFLVVERQPL